MMLEILIFFLFGALFLAALLELVRSFCREGHAETRLKWFAVIVKENIKPVVMEAKKTQQQQQCENTPHIV